MAERSSSSQVRHFERRGFLAGGRAVLPLAITIWIIRWLIELTPEPSG